MHENVPKLFPTPEVASKVIDYSVSKSTDLPEFLTKYHAWGVANTPVPDYLISTFQAQMLTWFTRAVGAKRVLEIGVYIGFSAMAWADAVGPAGKVVGLELSEKYAGIARKGCEENGIKNVEIIVGDAAKSLETMPIDEPYDMIFIDANKEAYPRYLEIILNRSKSGAAAGRMLKQGGLIIADNILRRSIMADPTESNPMYVEEITKHGKENNDMCMAGIEKFNTMMATHKSLETVLLPVFDGLGLARLLD